MPQRVRLPDQNKPITVNLYNRSNNALIQTISTNADEIELPNLNTGFYYTATNSQGKSSTRIIDNVTRQLMQKYHVGKSVSNGNPENHVKWIRKGKEKGFTYCGVIYNDVFSDAEIIALENSVFDHTINHSSYQFPFDESVREAYLTDPSGLGSRVCLKVGLLITRETNRLYNGTTHTIAYSLQDSSMRQDSSTPTYVPRTDIFPQGIVPSYASAKVESFADRYIQAFVKHYLPAILDGTIMCIGAITGNSGEAEFAFEIKNEYGDSFAESHGDFHLSMLAKFREAYPMYQNVSANTIYNNDRTGTELSTRWSYFLTRTMNEWEKKRIENLKKAFPQLAQGRTKFWQFDCGSYVDPLSPRRRTYGAFQRITPETLMIKFNDESNQSADAIKFTINYGASLARKGGCIGLYEPSPQNGNYADQGNRDNIKYQINDLMIPLNIGFSFYDESETNMDWFRANTNLQQSGIPKYIDEFEIVGGVKKLVRSNTNLSAILNTGGSYVARQNYETVKSAKGKTFIDINIVDDLASGIVGTTTTTTSSTTTTTPSGGGVSSTTTTTQFVPTTVEAGLTSANVNGKTYTMQNGRDVILSVLPNGNVKIDYPETMLSSNGSKICKGWLMNSYLEQVDPAEVAALRSTSGLAIPVDAQEGYTETFYVYWAAQDVATTFEHLRTKVWELFGNPDTRESNSAAMQYAGIEIFNN